LQRTGKNLTKPRPKVLPSALTDLSLGRFRVRHGKYEGTTDFHLSNSLPVHLAQQEHELHICSSKGPRPLSSFPSPPRRSSATVSLATGSDSWERHGARRTGLRNMSSEMAGRLPPGSPFFSEPSTGSRSWASRLHRWGSRATVSRTGNARNGSGIPDSHTVHRIIFFWKFYTTLPLAFTSRGNKGNSADRAGQGISISSWRL